MTEPINTLNAQFVGWDGTNVGVMMPRLTMTPDEALVHAAWLVTLADVFAEHAFADVLKAVQNT